jgi:hypothetical protein
MLLTLVVLTAVFRSGDLAGRVLIADALRAGLKADGQPAPWDVPRTSVGQRVARPLSESSPAGGTVVWTVQGERHAHQI